MPGTPKVEGKSIVLTVNSLNEDWVRRELDRRGIAYSVEKAALSRTFRMEMASGDLMREVQDMIEDFVSGEAW